MQKVSLRHKILAHPAVLKVQARATPVRIPGFIHSSRNNVPLRNWKVASAAHKTQPIPF